MYDYNKYFNGIVNSHYTCFYFNYTFFFAMALDTYKAVPSRA